MNEEKTELHLPSCLETIDEAAATAARIAEASGLNEGLLFGVDLAIREAVVNAIKHGNQFDEAKQVKIAFESSPQSFVISVEDEGAGFDLDSIPDPTEAANLLKESGRGILFMRSFMDEVTWQRAATGGTIVRMTKNF